MTVSTIEKVWPEESKAFTDRMRLAGHVLCRTAPEGQGQKF